MLNVQHNVLAEIRFKNREENQEILCIFSRTFTRNSSSIPTGEEEEEELDLEKDWQEFWSKNGENLIWSSWITRYSDYINPEYLPTNTKEEEKSVAKEEEENSSSNYFKYNDEESSRKIPLLTRYLSISDEKISEGWNQLSPLSLEGETEAEQHLLSSSRCSSLKTLDSMTNVTKITLSSFDFGSSNNSNNSGENLSISSHSSSSNNNNEPEEKIDEYNQDQWNILWIENYENEYVLQYNKFINFYDVNNKFELEEYFEDLTIMNNDDNDEDNNDEEQETVLMESMGLPTNFGTAIKSSILARKNVRNAFNLMGVNYKEENFAEDDDNGFLQSGEVNYKMKNIKKQNKRLKLKKSPLQNVIVSPSEEEETFGLDEIEETPSNQEEITEKKSYRKRKRKKRVLINYPEEILANSKLKKFYQRRFSLFSKFDEGIKLDEESWYSVTPEIIAKHAAERCACNIIIDGFCGAGGNAIQFAFLCERVIAIDIDAKKIDLARNNARVYGVEDKIDFIVGDFLQLSDYLKGDVVFLSPPWGGMNYSMEKTYDLETMLQPVGFSILIEKCKKISNSIAVFLPKNTNTNALIKMAGPNGRVEIEQDFINNRQISITAYYNSLIKD